MSGHDEGTERLAALFEQLRRTRVRDIEAGSRYDTTDVIAVLGLLARGYNPAEIERRTLMHRNTITRWQNAFLDGHIEAMYPDIRDKMATFDLSWLPPERKRRVRPQMAWQQSQMALSDRPNPYNGKGNGSA